MLEQDIEPHVAQTGLMPQHMGMQQWLIQRPAVFHFDGQRVSLTKQSIEYDRHMEMQLIALIQRLGRPAHMNKDIAPYCKQNNIDMRVSKNTPALKYMVATAFTLIQYLQRLGLILVVKTLCSSSWL